MAVSPTNSRGTLLKMKLTLHLERQMGKKIKMSWFLYHHYLIANPRNRYMNQPRANRCALLGISDLIGVTQRDKNCCAHSPGNSGYREYLFLLHRHLHLFSFLYKPNLILQLFLCSFELCCIFAIN